VSWYQEYNSASKYRITTYKITTSGIRQVRGHAAYDKKNNIIKYFKLFTIIIIID